MAAYLNKQLEHGHKFFTGDKITNADFICASGVFSHVWNDG